VITSGRLQPYGMVRPVGLGGYGMNQRSRPLSCFLILALLAVCSTAAMARADHKAPHAGKPHEASGARHHRNAAHEKAAHAKHVVAEERESARPVAAPSASADASPLSADLAAVKNAIDLARKAKTTEATAIQRMIADPAARKLVEWFILRHPDADANFSRYVAASENRCGLASQLARTLSQPNEASRTRLVRESCW